MAKYLKQNGDRVKFNNCYVKIDNKGRLYIEEGSVKRYVVKCNGNIDYATKDKIKEVTKTNRT